MTREELKEHCEKQIENCEMWARCIGEEPHGKIYEEHKLILELLEQWPKSEWEHDHEILKAYSDGANEVLDKIIVEIEQVAEEESKFNIKGARGLKHALKIINKYKEDEK